MTSHMVNKQAIAIGGTKRLVLANALILCHS